MLRSSVALRRWRWRSLPPQRAAFSGGGAGSEPTPTTASASALATATASSSISSKARAPRSLLAQKVGAYAELSKFRLSSLVVVTTGAGFLAAGGPVDATTMAAACIGTALCAGSAGTLNQLFEREQDALMNRTKLRPLPSQRVGPLEAAAFGSATAVAGTGLLLSVCGPATATLGAANIALYAGVYTWSKRHTELNTWVGSVVGAIPPVMGWTAATGASLSQIATEPTPMALAALLFLWQFPHFLSLAWMHREDYSRGGFKMVTTADPVGSRTAGFITEYSLYLTALPLLTTAGGLTGSMFAIEGVAANAYLLYLARRFQQDRSNANARRVFLCSLWYLPVLLAGFVLHNRVWSTSDVALITEGEGVTTESSTAEADLEGESIEGGVIGDAVIRARGALRGLCVHEVIASSNASNAVEGEVAGSGSSIPHLCAKQGLEKGVEVVSGGAVAAVEKVKEELRAGQTAPAQRGEN